MVDSTSSNNLLFSHALIKSIEPIMTQIYDHPFIQQMSNGTLNMERFQYYLIQDALYLRYFGKGLAMLAVKSDNSDHFVEFCDHAKGVVKAELQLHNEYFQTWNVSEQSIKVMEPSPTCTLYTSYLMAVALEKPLYEAIGAFLPCFWIYADVGRHIYETSQKYDPSIVNSNPYKLWIDTYRSDDFYEGVASVLHIMDEIAKELTDSQKEAVIAHFKRTSMMEYMFWDAAHKQEKWPSFPTLLDTDGRHLETSSAPPVALTIAGSDSGGGAGIQADLNTFHANGVFGTSAITALTAQNSVGVQDIFPIPVDFVRSQIQSVMSDMNVRVVKTGMLFSSDVIKMLAEEFSRRPTVKIVVDPVMISTSGSNLIKDDAIEALVTQLFPLAEVITPNIPEAQTLLKHTTGTTQQIQSIEDMERTAKLLADTINCKFVLLKGGHLQIHGDAVDVLYETGTGQFTHLRERFLNTTNTHGTGCSLASAIAANIAKRMSTVDAVHRAKFYVYHAILKSFRTGSGNGTLNHFTNY